MGIDWDGAAIPPSRCSTRDAQAALRGPTRQNTARKKKSGRSGRDDKIGETTRACGRDDRTGERGELQGLRVWVEETELE